MGWSSSPYEETIWHLLMNAINNEYGVAGLMGNLFAESGLFPLIIEGSGSSSNPVNTYYAEQVNTNTIPRDEFASYPLGSGVLGWTYYRASGGARRVTIPSYGDFGKGWGLAQWTTTARKRNFYDRCFPNIGSLELQVAFLIWELQNSYAPVWNVLINARTIDEASDYVLEHFEEPPDIEGKRQERRDYSLEIFKANTGSTSKLRYGAVRDVLRRLIIHA